MRLDLDAKVRTRDGEDAGRVQWAIVDPQSNEVTHVVVSTGTLFGRDVLVPRAELDRASEEGDVLRLQLSKEELAAHPTYAPAGYAPPPPTWFPPGGYGLPAGAYLWPSGVPLAGAGYPAPNAPAPAAGATGQAEAAAGLGAPEAVPSRTPVPGEPEEIAVGKGAAVVDKSGEDIGVVDEVLFDAERGSLRGFVLRIGGVIRTLFGGGETVEVPATRIERVGESTVYLNVTKEDLAPAAG